jgi:hypothetical protein
MCQVSLRHRSFRGHIRSLILCRVGYVQGQTIAPFSAGMPSTELATGHSLERAIQEGCQCRLRCGMQHFHQGMHHLLQQGGIQMFDAKDNPLQGLLQARQRGHTRLPCL